MLYTVRDIDKQNMTLDHKTSLKLLGYRLFVAIAKNTLYGQNYRFFLKPKIISILGKDHIP